VKEVQAFVDINIF